MKLVQWIAAAGFVATGLVGATAAQAQDWRYRDHHERRWDRHDRGDRHRGWDRGRHHGWDRGGYGYRSRTVCWNEWHHGRRTEVCRRR
ncbi:hypothetical protein SAMN03159338_2134 [Sphingomonas sp. NFR04]|uniref:hypothetical protein n=1 Tax=Sphingomonas sp. NFR04 TaxID=1566283 RepID=UPI0008E4D223|nr:hypothetical protein [Sphingomonas sp. NFR04]SFJ67344.1 hypothetical protein SAMN03159338_2134 [Sphingomonas sp. NFR04]